MERELFEIETAISKMKQGQIIRKESIKNDTAFMIHENKLCMLNESTGQRYPWSLTDDDIMASDYYLQEKK